MIIESISKLINQSFDKLALLFFKINFEKAKEIPIFAPPKNIDMSKICDLTGKQYLTGNHVSHSNHKTKRRFNPNLQTKRFYIPEEDAWITLKVSTSAIKTINKNGITAVLNKFFTKGTI